jgi:hypothetical protein
MAQYFEHVHFEPMAVEIIVQDYKSSKKSILPQQFTITNVY